MGKLQSLRLEAPVKATAPTKIRIFANQRNLDMDDAGGGVAATQEVLDIPWTSPNSTGSLSAQIEVNFLKFQNLGFLAIYFASGGESEDEVSVQIQNVRFMGRV